MSDTEPPALAPEMDELVEALKSMTKVGDQVRIMNIADYHGGYMSSFLRDIASYPVVEAALKRAAPSGIPKEQGDVMYAAIDYIKAHYSYKI